MVSCTEVLVWEILQDKQDSKHTSGSILLLASVYLWDELMLNDDRTFWTYKYLCFQDVCVGWMWPEAETPFVCGCVQVAF